MVIQHCVGAATSNAASRDTPTIHNDGTRWANSWRLRWLFHNTISIRFTNVGAETDYSAWQVPPGNILEITLYANHKFLPQALFAATLPLNSKVTSRSRVFPDKLIVTQLVKKYPAFYGTWMFSVVRPPMVPIFSQINPLHKTTLHVPCGLFLPSFPTKILYELLTSPCALHATPTSSSLIWSL
jgi:hypothetical protein